MCKEVGVRQILVSQLIKSEWSEIPLENLLENAVGIAKRLRDTDVMVPSAFDCVPSNGHWSDNVYYEINLLYSAGVLSVDRSRIRKTSIDYQHALDFLFEDLDVDVKEKLFECAA